VKVPVVTAVTGEAKSATTKLAAAAGLTVIPDWISEMLLFTVSTAVNDWVPGVLRMTPLLKVCTPASALSNV
jgi:hypothetical protein